MKNCHIIVTLVLAGAICVQSFSQEHSWPPGGTVASPITASMKLPGNRYVPSSKKYNLVWADELFGGAPGKVRFIARNYVATQKISIAQVAAFREHNPNFLCIIYHLANGINPQNYNDCPLPHGNSDIVSCTPSGWVSEWNNYFVPWLTTAGITQGSARYEQMFQHYSAISAGNRVWHGDPQWTMCLENADWRTYLADATINWMSGLQNEGCFFDVCVETMVPGLYHPAADDPVPHDFNWYLAPYGPAGYAVATLGNFASWMNAQYLGYWQSLYRRFHTMSLDYLVLPNVDQMITGWYDPVWMDGNTSGETIDGAMMENFGGCRDADMYLSLSRAVRHLTGRGKILIAQWYDSTQAERYRRTGMYMLIKNECSFVNILAEGAPGWFPEYEISLGDQSFLGANLDLLRVAGTGSASLFKRDYQNGMVLCNTSGSAMNYSLPGDGWSAVVTSGGGSVSDAGAIAPQSLSFVPVSPPISIPASGCMILARKASGVGFESQKPVPEESISLCGSGRIIINKPGIVTVFDWKGRKWARKKQTRGRIILDTRDFPRGSYIIMVSGANGSVQATRRAVFFHE